MPPLRSKLDSDVLWSPETLTAVLTAPFIATNYNDETMLRFHILYFFLLCLFFSLYISNQNDAV